MNQLSKEQAIAIFEGGEWKDWTDDEIVKLQLYQKRLCVPLDIFHRAICLVFGRDVFSHEFAGDFGFYTLQGEYEGKHRAPTFEEIVAMIPAEKVMLI